MSIKCLLASKNTLLLERLNIYVNKTFFLEKFEGDELYFEDNYPMLMFFDLDSFKLNIKQMRKLLSLPLIPIFITSIYSRELVENWLKVDLNKNGYLSKSANYEDFINEISRIIDYRYEFS